VEVTLLGAGAAFESKWIRLADLKGNLFSYPETDEQYPTLWSQQRAVLLQLLNNPDPQMQAVLAHPENMALIKRMIGLEELVIPDEESRTKQYREIAQLVAESPIVVRSGAGLSPLSSASPVGAQHAVPGTNTWRDANHPPTSGGGASSSGGRSFGSDITDRREAPSSLPKAPFSSSPRERTLSASNSDAPEKIDAIYLSPDAFARRTDEASIAEQMGDIFVAAGLPRPIPAADDRIGGWMLMYQMLDAGEWLLTENCAELIRTLPNLIRDPARIEEIEKMDGDDAADAARYGLKSRYATSAAYSIEHLPYEARLAARVLSADPTVRAIQARKAQLEEHRRTKFVPRRGR